MKWHELYGSGNRPEQEEIDVYVASPLWGELRIMARQHLLKVKKVRNMKAE